MAVTALHRLHVLPALAIARLGSSPQPMDNFTVSPDPYDPPAPGDPQAALKTRVLTPAPTLQINSANGQITGNPTPATLRFRDDQGRIKPVAPFFELWAQFSEQGGIEPLTRQHLDDLRATVEWRV